MIQSTVKALFFALLACCCFSQQAGAQTPAPSPSIASNASVTLVPRGTLIVVQTTRGTNSYGSETGSKLTYILTQDVIVDGHIVAKAGDVAEGAIQNAEAGRDDYFTQKAANLRVSVDRVYNFCGDTIETDFMRSEYRRRQGVFGSHKDVEVIKGQLYQVPTERPQRVCSEPSTEAPPPIPSDALVGDSR
jgi:hypothetical protein